MSGKLGIVVVVIAFLNVVAVVEFVRRRKLGESFALLWIGVGVGGIVLSLIRPLIDDVADELGVTYGPTLLFAATTLFLLFVCMNLSMHVSRLTERTETLAEEIAFLRGVLPPNNDTEADPAVPAVTEEAPSGG
jgi:hypothetical protein